MTRSPLPGALALLAALGAVSARPAQAAEASAWVRGLHSQARLIEGGAAADGGLMAGLEVRLDPAFITYWRDPGDAGVPPSFDFAGSTNLKSAEVRYPAPARIDEAGAAAFGYAGDVTFPIAVVPVDPAEPVGLHVALAYAACHDICLPARATLAIRLDGHASAEASRVAEALAAVPRPAAPGEEIAGLAILGATSAPADGLRIDAAGPPGTALFVEAPESFAFEVGPAIAADGRLVFPVKRVEGPETAPPPLTLTLVAPGAPRRAIEVRLHLDGAAKRP